MNLALNPVHRLLHLPNLATFDNDFEETYPHFAGRLSHQLHPSDDEDRRSRFQSSSLGGSGAAAALRDRAASQPPRSSQEQGYMSSPSTQTFVPSSLGGSGTSPWTNSRLNNNRGQPVVRSPSLSHNPSQFGSMMRERAFPSTFEDDESQLLDDDTYDEHYMPPSLSRGRSYGQDISRSRSHSLATPTTRNNLVVGSPYNANPTASAMQSWNESYLSNSNPLNIPGGRGYDAPATASRYGSSLGAIARSPSNNYSSSPITGPSFAGNGYSRHQPPPPDVSNMSPFRRDVAQILLDDGPFRELWAGMNPPRDESGGSGSGTTSRRHSVSVQPRRGTMVGFSAPGSDSPEEHHRTTTFGSGFGGRSGLMLDDDDLASDLGMLNLNPKDQGLPSSRIVQPPSQPASLPIYAPLSRSPPSKELFHPMLNIPSNSSTYSRQLRTPSDGGLSAGGNGGNQSPTLASNLYDREGQYYSHSKTVSTNSATSRAPGGEAQGELTARYVPGQGIHYINTSNLGNQGYVRARAPSYSNQGPPGLTTPVSPTSGRLINPQQQPYYPQAMQRRSSNAHESQPPSAHPSNQNATGPPQNLNELGKGVPLHAIPSSCPLYIVEFKAGRTDLFYTTDSSQNIQVGDLVVVEADRGKDLGTVVNDTITLPEVEAFQKQQAERNAAMGGGGGGGGGGNVGHDGQPVSPTISSAAIPGSGGKKDIHPKMIYGKAGPQDTQTLAIKQQDEAKALQLCQSKVRAKKLPMEVIDAEYQWDRRKLTFYFVAEKRIDFRELVRELFRLYKTRIWMASLQGVGGFEQ